MPIIKSTHKEKKTIIVHDPDVYVCDRCGARNEDGEEYWDWLPVTLELGFTGEEGWGRVQRIFCRDCWSGIVQQLLDIGLGSHYHGGINFLEDLDCPSLHGDGKCPNPEGYGGGPYEDE